MNLRLIVLLAPALRCCGWWYGDNQTKPTPPTGMWAKFERTMPETAEVASRWWEWGADNINYYNDMVSNVPTLDAGPVEFSLWMILDALFGFFGWAIFGSAWTSVKSGCRRALQMVTVLTVCLIAHYIWAVCCPIVSIIVACLMALVWVLRRVVRVIGTMFFHVQRIAGGVPEAADVEFVGPGTGDVRSPFL